MAAGGEAQRPWQQKVDEALRPLSAATTRLVGCFRATPARAVWGRNWRNPVARLPKHKGVSDVHLLLCTGHVDAGAAASVQASMIYGAWSMEHGAWIMGHGSIELLHSLLFPCLSRLDGIGKRTKTNQPTYCLSTLYLCMQRHAPRPNHHRNHHTM
jgi:hypothetical protein